MMNEFDNRYIEAVLHLHERIAGLDSKDDAETRIWHLVRSLLEYCDAQHPRLDFDAILASVREDFNSDDMTARTKDYFPPKSKTFVQAGHDLLALAANQDEVRHRPREDNAICPTCKGNPYWGKTMSNWDRCPQCKGRGP